MSRKFNVNPAPRTHVCLSYIGFKSIGDHIKLKSKDRSMGKKNRNKRNRLQKQTFDSNPGGRWSIAVLDARKELELELERNEDIMSSMPGDILSHVISFLPFESAVQTSFLSTRWRNVWKSNFSQRKGSIHDAFAAISSFLDGCSDRYSEQRPVSNWGFIFNLGKRSFISVAADPYKALQLDFSNVKHEFPKRFDWTLDVNGPIQRNYWFYDRFDTHSPSSLSFKIKTLHLKSVSYIFSGAISSMMINFTFLKNLKIEKCHGLRSLKLNSGASSRLKNLTILDCQHLESLHLNHLRLDSLRFRGKLLSFQGVSGCSLWFWRPWSHAFELVDAMLDFREGPGCISTENCQLQSFFRGITKHVKSLTMSGWIFEPLIYPMLHLYPFPFDLKLNCLTELWWIDYAKDRFNSNPLIAFLNLCPRLARLYVTIDPKSYRRTNTINKYSVGVPSVSRLEDLKVVKLEGFRNEKEEIMLAKRLKQEFHVEPLILAKSNYLNCVRLMVKVDDVNDWLKEGEDSYKFIETRVEHLHDLCPKHLHMCI